MEFTFDISMVEAIIILAGAGLIVRLIIWYANVNSDRKSFKEFMGRIEKKIEQIFERLPSRTIESQSPIRLNELGRKISGKLDAATWAMNEAEKFSEKIEGADALGIQEIAFQHAQEFEPSGALLEKMRTSAYEGGVDIRGVRDVLGVELRDVLLDKRGFHESELDNRETDANTGT